MQISFFNAHRYLCCSFSFVWDPSIVLPTLHVYPISGRAHPVYPISCPPGTSHFMPTLYILFHAHTVYILYFTNHYNSQLTRPCDASVLPVSLSTTPRPPLDSSDWVLTSIHLLDFSFPSQCSAATRTRYSRSASRSFTMAVVCVASNFHVRAASVSASLDFTRMT